MGKTDKEQHARWREHVEWCDACKRRDGTCSEGERLEAKLTHRMIEHYVEQYFHDALGG